MRSLFGFPEQINEKAARVVAGTVCLLAILTLASGWYWITAVLAYGFIARVASGPKLSPLGWLASKRIAPLLGDAKPVPGPPKRFAQGMGAVMTSTAAVLALVAQQHAAADALLGALIFAAALESIFAYCLGCTIFSLLMRAGIVSESACAECADIWSRPSAARP